MARRIGFRTFGRGMGAGHRPGRVRFGHLVGPPPALYARLRAGPRGKRPGVRIAARPERLTRIGPTAWSRWPRPCLWRWGRFGSPRRDSQRHLRSLPDRCPGNRVLTPSSRRLCAARWRGALAESSRNRAGAATGRNLPGRRFVVLSARRALGPVAAAGDPPG
jgi:hypothetical protein